MSIQEYIYRQRKMVRTAMYFGIASIVCSMLFQPFFSIPLGCFAILFALLSRGTAPTLSNEGWAALITGLLGIAIAAFLLASVYNALAHNAVYRAEIIKSMETLYGDTFKETYGKSISDVINGFFSGKE